MIFFQNISTISGESIWSGFRAFPPMQTLQFSRKPKFLHCFLHFGGKSDYLLEILRQYGMVLHRAFYFPPIPPHAKSVVSPSSEGIRGPYDTPAYHQSVILGTGAVFITVGASPNSSGWFLGSGLFIFLYWWLRLWYLYEVQKPSVYQPSMDIGIGMLLQFSHGKSTKILLKTR